MALQNAESRGESFSKEDFLEGRVGSRMIPEDFNFEENVRFLSYQLFHKLEFAGCFLFYSYELRFVVQLTFTDVFHFASHFTPTHLVFRKNTC